MPSKTFLTREQALALLQETPLRIGALTRGLAPGQLQTRPSQDEWSAPTLRAINPRTWINKTDYRELEFEPSLRAFMAQRTQLLAVLEPLAQDGWSRTATVTGAGRVLERTVMFYAGWLARHERQHHKQFDCMVKTLR